MIRATVTLAVLLSGACSAAEINVSDSSTEQTTTTDWYFVQQLQEFVARNDVRSIAKLIHYPIGVEVDGVPTVIAGPEEFAAAYERIFTPRVKAGIYCQSEDNLFVNQYGIMVGQGDLWVSAVDDSPFLKIYRINNSAWLAKYRRGDEVCFKAAIGREAGQ